VPVQFRYWFIDTFKKHPEPYVGIAGSGVLKRIIRYLDRFGIVTVFLPFVLLAICMAMLPDFPRYGIGNELGGLGTVSFINLRPRKRPRLARNQAVSIPIV
jgi:hypothetical protein